MQTLGDYLKKGREARNISLSDVSDYTKISKIYLDCLENDEYANIPAEPYVKGYISSYAACVGINEHEALKLYDNFQIEAKDAQELNSEILDDKRSSTPLLPRFNKKIWLISTFSFLIVIGIGVYYSFFPKSKKDTVDQGPVEGNKPVLTAILSAIESDLQLKRQDGYFFQFSRQTDIEKKIENREVSKKHDIEISQIAVPLVSHPPKQNSTKEALYPPMTESSLVRDLSGSEIIPTQLEYNLSVIEAIACSNIVGRIPEGIKESYEWSVDRIYVWSRIKCEKPPSSIRHIYYFKGKKVNDIVLKIHSDHWRTWSYKTISNRRYIGPWRVDITSVDGRLLQSLDFEIK